MFCACEGLHPFNRHKTFKLLHMKQFTSEITGYELGEWGSILGMYGKFPLWPPNSTSLLNARPHRIVTITLEFMFQSLSISKAEKLNFYSFNSRFRIFIFPISSRFTVNVSRDCFPTCCVTPKLPRSTRGCWLPGMGQQATKDFGCHYTTALCIVPRLA